MVHYRAAGYFVVDTVVVFAVGESAAVQEFLGLEFV